MHTLQHLISDLFIKHCPLGTLIVQALAWRFFPYFSPPSLRMIKSQPQEYSFIPKTWIFPAEYTQFQNYVKELRRKRKQKTFIVKPANGAMGHGYVTVLECSANHFLLLMISRL